MNVASKQTEMLKAISEFESIDAEVIQVFETAVSIVFVSPNYAYKLKKPVNFGFLDYSTLPLRRKFCDQEIILNKKGADPIYLDVLAVGVKEESFFVEEIEDSNVDKYVDYLVHMKAFDNNKRLSEMLESNKVSTDDIKDLVDRIIQYQKSAPKSKDASHFGSMEVIKKAFDENIEQTQDYVGSVVTEDQFNSIKEGYERFWSDSQIFEARVDSGKIRHLHGDLHADNICFYEDQWQLFDCIEFNDEFMNVDVIYDMAFLIMDLEARGKSDLAAIASDYYFSKVDDPEGKQLVPLYLARQAHVRAKIACFMLANNPEDQVNIDKAKKYFELTYKFITTQINY